MSPRFRRLALVAALAILPAACISPNPPSIKPEAAAYIDLTRSPEAFSPEAFLRLINNYRHENGLDPLALDPELTRQAQFYADAMARADRMTHELAPYGGLTTRLAAQGYRYAEAAENLGQGQKTIAEIFTGWRKSPAHDENMRQPALTRVGIAFALNMNTRYKIFWTLELARPRSADVPMMGVLPGISIAPMPVGF